MSSWSKAASQYSRYSDYHRGRQGSQKHNYCHPYDYEKGSNQSPRDQYRRFDQDGAGSRGYDDGVHGSVRSEEAIRHRQAAE